MKDYKQASKVLVIGAGGGNDSFSCFLLLSKLKQNGFNPKHIDVAAMLPSCLEYQNTKSTEHPLVQVITPESTRSVNGNSITAFPEKVLSSIKGDLPFNVETIFGLNMEKGSVGVLSALNWICFHQNYDLVIAIDVGGDFITEDGNTGVLSPQMDGYVGWALKQLSLSYPVVYGVFGFGTDGESSTYWIEKCLEHAKDSILEEGYIDATKEVNEVASMYKNKVEPNRYSRTTDYTLKEIMGSSHPNPSPFRCRFHVKTDDIGNTKKFYAYYEHEQDPKYFGYYVLLSDIGFVKNRYSVECSSAAEWIKKVHSYRERVNHELCGQYEQGVYYCLPSFRFSASDRYEAFDLAVAALNKGLYASIVVYTEDLERQAPSNVVVTALTRYTSKLVKNELT